MNKKVMLGVGVIVLASVGFIIYRKRKIGKNIAKAQLDGFIVGGCKDGYITGKHSQNRMAVQIPCGIFKF